MKPMLLTLILLAISPAWGQQPGSTKPHRDKTQMSEQARDNNTPASRQGAESLSQSTIEGCLMGSDGRFLLTDIRQGTMYHLSGNDSLLKGHVGQQVAITGVVNSVESSGKKGQPGPSKSDQGGTAGTREGSQTKNFQVHYVKETAERCQTGQASQANAISTGNAALGSVANGNSGGEPQMGYSAGREDGLQGCLSGGPGNFMLSESNLHRRYKIEGDNNQLQQQVGHEVKIAGHLQPGETPVFQADSVQQLAAACNYQSNESAQAVAGKQGNRGDQIAVSSTGSYGATTPGSQTEAGEAQKPGSTTGGSAGGTSTPPNRTEKQGAPAPPEQIGQDRASAERIAQAAHQAEIGGSKAGNYGVNGNAPDYSPAKGQKPATQENNTPGSASHNGVREREQKSEVATRGDSSSNSTLTGCLEASQNGREFTLTTQDGRHVLLDGAREQFKDHLNHTVQVVGRQQDEAGQSTAAAGRGKTAKFTVAGVSDLAPTCGGSSK